jgi:uncharacterized phage protein (TIGR02218 family)
MKTTSAGINTALSGQARFAADMYTFFFAEGTVRWTAAASSLSYGGNTWVATGPLLTRGGSRSVAGLETDTIMLTLAPGAVTLGSRTLKLAAIQGSFDGIRVLIQRAYMTTWGTIPGLVTQFDGTIVNCQSSSTEIELTVKSILSRLDETFPRRAFSPQCAYSLGDTQCGKTIASYQHSRTATGGTTTTVIINSTSSFAVVGGYVAFTSGALSGTRRTIANVVGTTLTFDYPVLVAPTTEALTVTMGCDKTRATCRDTFANLAKYGGFPDTPKSAAGK